MKKWFKHEMGNDAAWAFSRVLWEMRKFLAILLILGFLVSLLPRQNHVSASSLTEETPTESTEPVDAIPDYPTTTDLDSNIKDVALVGEVESMRTECTKTFQRVDGTFVLALYNEAVHYQKDGKWEEIDNTLAFDESDSSYKNRHNAFEVKFPDSLDGNKKIKLSMGDYEVTWSVLDMGKSSIQCGEPESKSSDIKELSGINQDILYEDVMAGVDLQYIIAGTQVKENIILGKYSKDFSISFEYSVKNLVLDRKDGHYAFFDENGNLIFDFSSLFAYDAEGDIFEDIALSVSEKNKNVYEVVVSLDDKWASQANYPVTIDPSISLPSPGLYIRDTYVRTGSTTNYSGSAYVYFGDNLLYSYLGYLNFTVPTYLKDFDIIYSTLFLHRYTGTDDMFLHELPSYISNLGGLTWANRPTADTQLIDFGVVSSTNTEIQLDITTSVDKWNKLGLTNMPGFEFSSNDTLLRVYSIDSATTPPSIEIGFIDSNGIKDYWTYNSQDVSYAGTGYISDYTQDLYFVRNDINFQTDLQTLGVSFAFNNKMALSSTPNIGYGNGWNISYNLMLYYDSALALNYSIDYSGNRVYYYPTTVDSRTPNNQVTNHLCYLAEDGSGSKLVKKYVSGVGLAETFILTTDNTKYSFDVVYNDLISISSLDNDLTLTISRNSNRKKIDYVLDKTGNQIFLSYGTNGNLQSATLKTKDDSGTLHELEKVYYGYYGTTNFLHDIWYLTDYDQSGDLTLNLSDLKNVDRIVRYDHYASKLLATAYVKYINETTGTESIGEEIRYHYYSDTDPAVSFFESFFNSTKYSEITYDNVPRQTMITDHSGNFVLYSFDRYGHTVNVLDCDGNAIYYKYLDIFADLGSYVNGYPNYVENHKVVYESTPQKPSFSPISNPSFELGLTGWNVSAAGGSQYSSQGNVASSGEYSLITTNAANGWVSASQTISLDEGVYTICVEVKNHGVGTNAVYVSIGSETKYVEATGTWNQLTFVVIVDEDQTDVTITLDNHAVGTVYFDNLSFTEGVGSQLVNIVENSSFEFGLTSNWIDGGFNVNYYSINDQSGVLNDLYTEVLGERAIGLQGTIFTTIPRNAFEEKMDANGTLYIGGWALNYTAPSVNNANLVEGKKCEIFLQQYDLNGDVLQGTQVSFPFNLSYDNWQYVFGETTINSLCAGIDVGFRYTGYGEVLFDGLSVFYDENATKNDFDGYGRMEHIYKDNGITYTFAYPVGEPESNQIPNTISDQNGHSISISSANNKITGITRNNVKTSPVYNSSGQIQGYNIKKSDDSITYFSTSTIYAHNSQYMSSSTDEYGETTNYYTNVINGLMERIRNSAGSDTFYEYYDDGILKKVSATDSYTNEESYVEYIYDAQNNLKEIHAGDDLTYFLNYDTFGRIASVQVNNQTLMSYSYLVDTYETDFVSSQTYANGDVIQFVYEEDTKQIAEIQFQGSGETLETRFRYKYDSNGRIAVYEDVTLGTTEFYEYDTSGNLSKISYSDGDSIHYSYDSNGKLSDIQYDISDSTFSVEYFNEESISNPELYDKTSFSFSSTISFVKNYGYTYNGVDDKLNRLRTITYQGTVDGYPTLFFTTSFGYEDDLTRVNSLTFHSTWSAAIDFQYLYEYDEIGNITQEKYRKFNPTTQVFYDVVTKKYYFDDLNQLVQESVYDTRVNCSLVADIDSCYIKTFDYDTQGNITAKKTFKYFSTNQHVIESSTPMPVSYEINSGNSDMFVYYNTNHRSFTTLYTEVGETISLSFIYYDSYAFPLQRVIKVFTDVDTSGVDINTPGIYLIECHAYNITEEYILDFGIVVNVGDVVYGELVKETSFQYDSTWVDQLGEYTVTQNGVETKSEIQYDAQGNPVNITNFFYNGSKRNHAVLSWDGRQLTNIQIYSETTTKFAEIWYTYNDQGLRVMQLVDSIVDGIPDGQYRYVLSGSLVASEIYSTRSGSTWVEQYQINYLFDYDGSLMGFKYCSGSTVTTYLYVTNLQGDIVKIVNLSGDALVEYSYDAYGNITSVTGTLATTIGQKNSYRYRSYLFDSSTGFYYLSSRYFNPEIGRFINADGLLGEVGDIFSTNMYAYCSNNPVRYVDPSGFIEWQQVWNVVFAISLIIAVTVIVVVTAGLAAFALGATAALVSTMTVAGITGGLIAGGVNLAMQTMENGTENYDYLSLGFSAMIGSVSGFLSGGVASLSSSATTATQILIQRGTQVGFNILLSNTMYVGSALLSGEEVTFGGLLISTAGGFISGYTYSVPSISAAFITLGIETATYYSDFFSMFRKKISENI